MQNDLAANLDRANMVQTRSAASEGGLPGRCPSYKHQTTAVISAWNVPPKTHRDRLDVSSSTLVAVVKSTRSENWSLKARYVPSSPKYSFGFFRQYLT